jgi:hypothetical protein
VVRQLTAAAVRYRNEYYGDTRGLLRYGRTVETAVAARGVFRIDSYGGDKNAPAPATPPDVPPFVIVLLLTHRTTAQQPRAPGNHYGRLIVLRFS